MARIILAVILGFFAWSILWVGSDQVIRSISPEWYGSHQAAIEVASFNNEPFESDDTINLISLLRSIIFSMMAGFLTAIIAGENKSSTLILGVALLVVGIIFQIFGWNYFPVWYHVLFLVLLVPMTILGGKLRTSS
ncbi:MAG: hypothetical protein KF685_02205 [Acidobacteria bacterium]|nr:hypothetical protein [Acidobacteriota bacterium]